MIRVIRSINSPSVSTGFRRANRASLRVSTVTSYCACSSSNRARKRSESSPRSSNRCASSRNSPTSRSSSSARKRFTCSLTCARSTELIALAAGVEPLSSDMGPPPCLPRGQRVREDEARRAVTVEAVHDGGPDRVGDAAFPHVKRHAALRILVLAVDGGRHAAVLGSEQRGDHLEHAGGGPCVA